MHAITTKLTASTGPFAGLDPNLVKQTQKWVGQTFFGTLLKQMRESPFKDTLFSGGRGGEAFGAMYDQQLADRMSRGVGTKLVRAIARKLEAKKAYEKAGSGKQKSAVARHEMRA